MRRLIQADRRGGRSSDRSPISPAPDSAEVTRQRTALQERFCLEYMADRDATAAYRRARGDAAGKGARQIAHKLLQLPHVQARIAELDAAESVDARRRRQIRIGTLMRILLDPREKTVDRLRAIELSGKIDGDFVEKHEHTILAAGRAERLKLARERIALQALPALVS